jgi:hypothetical protein
MSGKWKLWKESQVLVTIAGSKLSQTETNCHNPNQPNSEKKSDIVAGNIRGLSTFRVQGSEGQHGLSEQQQPED